MRFGVAVLAGTPWSRVAGQAHTVETLGFDVLMTGDHVRYPSDPAFEFLDGWTVLAGWATLTSRVRLAMLVSNVIYRNPALLARQAVAVDHLSAGRLDLGIGTGIFETDHAMPASPCGARPSGFAGPERSSRSSTGCCGATPVTTWDASIGSSRRP